jgi:hypothetical protein
VGSLDWLDARALWHHNKYIYINVPDAPGTPVSDYSIRDRDLDASRTADERWAKPLAKKPLLLAEARILLA